MSVFIVLLGPPGAGKGTQAEVIAEKYHLAHVSSGDIFRENLKAQTELGKLTKGYIDRGELVPDGVTIAMIRDRLSRSDCQSGALLDGFPRTPAQADALAAMLSELGAKIRCVTYISVPPQVLIERLAERWTCRAQSHAYHIQHNPPKVAGICDLDGSELYQREDDKPATVENRIKVYFEQTAPLIEYYRTQGLLKEIDGTQNIDLVTSKILEAIGRV